MNVIFLISTEESRPTAEADCTSDGHVDFCCKFHGNHSAVIKTLHSKLQMATSWWH